MIACNPDSCNFVSAMKGITTVILLLLFSVQTFSKWMWVLDYNLNQAYIATTLCVNKNKPKLHCNGHCQLSKKMAEDEPGKEQPGSTPKVQFNSVFAKPDMPTELLQVALVPAQPQPEYQLRLCTAIASSVFHPPAV